MEERNIQINDLVIIGNNLHKVVKIYNDNSIKISNNKNSILKPDKIGDYYLNGDLLRFSPMLTYSPFLDIKIISYVDDEILKVLCILDAYVSELCKDETLWEEKLELKFGENISEYIKDDLRLKYKFLSRYNTYKEISNNAGSYGQLDILKWVYSINKIMPDQDSVNIIPLTGRLKTLKWVYKINKMLPNQTAVNTTVMFNNLDVLKWLYKINGMLPDQNGVNVAAASGRPDILEWIYGINKMLPDQDGVNDARSAITKMINKDI